MSTRWARRAVVAAGLLTLTVALVVTGAPLASARPFDRPQSGFAPVGTRLRTGSPESVGLRRAPIDQAAAALRGYQSAASPLYPGAVAVLGHQGRVVRTEVIGDAVRYGPDGTELPAGQRVPMRADTVFDLASVSKLFTSVAVVQLVERGQVELDSPVARYLPEFAAQGKGQVTVRQLLTHTSALPAWLPLWSQYPDRASRITAVLQATPTGPAGSVYRYSDLNMITLGVLVERVTGSPLDVVVAEQITKPLRMSDTGYRPVGRVQDRRRVAATEYQTAPPRGVVWGEVHDENAWSLGGVAGHAGVFSTAQDLSVLSQTLINGGRYRGRRILAARSVELLITNFNTAFPGDDHGLGFELNQRWYAEGLSGPRQAGHTGFTGTSLVIDFSSRSFAILLTNRVHPARTGASVNPARRAWAQGLALAMPVRPEQGGSAWFTGIRNDTTATLDLALDVPGAGAKVSFRTFVDVEATEPLILERSTDDQASWQPVPFTVYAGGRQVSTEGSWPGDGRRAWVGVVAPLAGGRQWLRWRHSTDAQYLGRGIYLDAVSVTGPDGYRIDTEANPELFTADGWQAARY